ncbi:glycosyltransferase family 2 protein [Cloacibacillus sp. An23]|uniref:glycosyltransferase family 2 protein n=1 Tax=Cloacibacillus sp. An23 TaxID=1965591 RepID=UPI000B39010B|nr:glycosyltransferase family 2 protein [Cloacibacillus sp. An23]OUO90975.1 hypothetical protein B5F39_13635 [Cloacibacillus sp. An23]
MLLMCVEIKNVIKKVGAIKMEDLVYKIPTISIIIPVFNIEYYLDRCIKSVQKQTYQDIEIILIDDCSTDQSPTICDKLASNDRRIKVVHHQTNKGVSAARNTGIKLATGEWIMFVDGDDWIDPDAVEQLYQRIQEYCDVVVATYTWEREGESKQASPVGFEEHIYKSTDRKKYLLGLCLVRPVEIPETFPEDMLKCPTFGGPISKLYRKSFLIKNRIIFPTNIKFGEDRVFNLEVMYYARSVQFFNKSIYHYYIRTGSALNSELSICFDKRSAHIKAIYLFMHKYSLTQCLSIYYNYCCFINIRETIQYICMSLNSIHTYFLAWGEIKHILNSSIYRGAINNLQIKNIQAIRDKVILSFLKMRWTFAILFICWTYYTVYNNRNRLTIV